MTRVFGPVQDFTCAAASSALATATINSPRIATAAAQGCDATPV